MKNMNNSLKLSPFEQKVAISLSRHSGLSPDLGPVIVGLSGGADSVALLLVMTSLGYSCIAAHCNFQLRGSESERDMAHARAVAERLGASFECVRFDVGERRLKTGESVEMACRELRYGWFATLIGKHGAQALLTGHNREDNVETMFLNLNRGSGIRGVAGIAFEGDRRVSPLLYCSRGEIVAYLEEKGLSFVTDSTNLTNDYQRNRWRNVVLPKIENEFEGFFNRVSRSLSFLDEDRMLLDAAISHWRDVYMPDPTRLDLAEVSQSPLAGAIVFRLLRDFGFDREQTDSISKSADKSGKRYFSEHFGLVINRGVAEIYRLNNIISLAELEVDVIDVDDVDWIKDGSRAYFDAQVVEGDHRLEVRKWKPGDRIRPFGMGGRSKKVSDLFNDMKVSVSVKDSVPLLVCDGEVIWVAGLRASECFRVTSSTRRVAVFKIK